MQSLYSLQIWLECRGIPFKSQDSTKEMAVRLTNLALALGKKDKIVPSKFLINSTHHHYISWDYLFTDKSLVWNNMINNEITLLGFIRNNLENINDEYINKIFGFKKNGIRLKALNLVKSGHYDISTMQTSSAKLISDNNLGYINVFIIKVQTTPSMKSKCYWLYLVCNENGEYIPSPISRCDCPVGRLFCSHMLGFFLILRTIQQKTEWDHKSIMKYFPEPIKSLNSLCMAHDYIYSNTKQTKKTKTRLS